MTLAVDISNYTSLLTPAALGGLKSEGVSHVIVQAVDPPAPFPPGRTRDQIQACLNAGLTVDAYIWLWFDLDPSDIQRKLQLLDGLNIRQLWLDVEDTAASQYNQATTEQKVSAALELCDAYATSSGEKTGIYSGRWFWVDRRYMANTETYKDRELWDANYDDVAEAALGFAPYGGWDHVAIKQYRGTSVLAGVSGLDLNVLSVGEATELSTPPSDQTPPADQTPTRETPDDWPWPTWEEAAQNYKGIADELGRQLEELKQAQAQAAAPA
jgi:hypothetical protein